MIQVWNTAVYIKSLCWENELNKTSDETFISMNASYKYHAFIGNSWGQTLQRAAS